MPNNFKKTEVISTEELKKLVEESGLKIPAIERALKMPDCTLKNSLRGVAEKNGYVRTLPTKWVPKVVAYLKSKKIEHIELKEEIKEVLQVHNIEVVEPKVDIPDEERKRAWIEKMQEVKSELN